MDFLLRPWRREDAADIAPLANNRAVADNLRDIFPYPYTCLLYTSVNAEGLHQIGVAGVNGVHIPAVLQVFFAVGATSASSGHLRSASPTVSAVRTPRAFASSFFARMTPCRFSGLPHTAMGTVRSSGRSTHSTEA